MSDKSLYARQLTHYLIAAVSARQRVYLINYNKTQVSEQTNNIVGAINKHGLERLRRYL